MKSRALIEYEKYSDLYFDKFGVGYPMFEYEDYPEEVVKKIKRCLQENKRVEFLYPRNVSDDVII